MTPGAASRCRDATGAAQRLFAHLAADATSSQKLELGQALREAERAFREKHWSWAFTARGVCLQRRMGAGQLQLFLALQPVLPQRNPDHKLAGFDAELICPDDYLDRELRTNAKLRKLPVYELRDDLTAALSVAGSTILFRCEVYEGFLALRKAERGTGSGLEGEPRPVGRDNYAEHLDGYLVTSLYRHLQMYGVDTIFLKTAQDLARMLYEQRKSRALAALQTLSEE